MGITSKAAAWSRNEEQLQAAYDAAEARLSALELRRAESTVENGLVHQPPRPHRAGTAIAGNR